MGVRGAREVPYLSSGKSWYLESAALAGDDPLAVGDLLLQAFLAEAQRVPPRSMRTTRLGFRLSEGDREEVLGRLHALIEEIASRPSDPDGVPWGLFLALHPETASSAEPGRRPRR